MRKKEIGYILLGVIMLGIIIMQFISDGFWMISTGLFFGGLINLFFSYQSRRIFKTKISYFFPNFAFIFFGVLFIVLAIFDDTWGAIAYAVFGLLFVSSALISAPTYLIFDESFELKQKINDK